MINDFYNKFDELKRIVCEICNEIDFDMQLKKHEIKLMC